MFQTEHNTLLKIFLNSLLTLQHVERGSIWVKKEEEYLCVEAMGEQSDQVRELVIGNEQPSIVGWVIENGRRTISEPGRDDRHYTEAEESLTTKSQLILCFPLVLETGDVYGAVQLIDTSERGSQLNLEQNYLELLENIISVGSIALSKELAYSRQVEENLELKKVLGRYRADQPIIGQSPKLMNEIDKIKIFARVDYPVLITGDSGTGKELFARELHRLSARHDEPFLVQNCSAIPETLLETELFGHVKGAFTGASQDKKGLFETADKGVVFLDEIGDMPYNLQVKILRVIQGGEIKPVGSPVSKHVDVRIVSATNADLTEAIATKKFREDLYYRLNVLPLHVPALNERTSDIPLLLKSFLAIETKKLGITPKKISPQAMDHLEKYSWPGNIRELENFVRHMLVMTPGDVITVDDLPPQYISGDLPDRMETDDLKTAFSGKKTIHSSFPAPDKTWHEVEYQYMMALMEKTRWNISLAARMAGLNRSTFDSRLKRLGIRKN